MRGDALPRLEARHREICIAAAHTLVERGYGATSVNDIAAALGMTKAGLYHYITSKESLLFDIITLGMNSLGDEVVKATRGIKDPEERFRQIVLRHAALATCNRGVVTLLAEEVHALGRADRRAINQRRREYVHYVRDALADLARAGRLRAIDPTVAAFSALGAILWLPQWFQSGGRLTSEQVAAELAGHVLHGLLPAAPKRDRSPSAEGRGPRRPAARASSRIDSRRRQVCMMAARTLVERGYDATSVRDIAAALGVTKAGLYHYIRSKEDLLLEILSLGLDSLDEEVVKPLRGVSDPEEHLRQLVERHARLTAGNEPWITVLLEELPVLPPAGRRTIEQRKRDYFDLVRGRIRQLQASRRARPVDSTVAAFGVLAMVLWIPRWMKPKGRLTPDQVAAQVADIALHGVVASGDRRGRRP